jgi:hypothetical protein
VAALELRSVNTSYTSRKPAEASKIAATDSHFIDSLDPQLRDLDAAGNQMKESTVGDQDISALPSISDADLNRTAFQGDVDEDGIAALVDNDEEGHAMLGGDANIFIMTFANYNVVLRSSKKLLKDGETQLQLKCKNHIHGCIYETGDSYSLTVHEKKCTVTAPKLAQAQKPVKCKAAGCNKRFDDQTKMTTHHWKVHQWKPKKCTKSGCTDDREFKSRTTYEQHIRSHEVTSAWQNRPCPLAGCSNETVYEKKGSLRAHLENRHGIFREELKEYLKDNL